MGEQKDRIGSHEAGKEEVSAAFETFLRAAQRTDPQYSMPVQHTCRNLKWRQERHRNR
jgi:hypothetical protein